MLVLEAEHVQGVLRVGARAAEGDVPEDAGEPGAKGRTGDGGGGVRAGVRGAAGGCRIGVLIAERYALYVCAPVGDDLNHVEALYDPDGDEVEIDIPFGVPESSREEATRSAARGGGMRRFARVCMAARLFSCAAWRDLSPSRLPPGKSTQRRQERGKAAASRRAGPSSPPAASERLCALERGDCEADAQHAEGAEHELREAGGAAGGGDPVDGDGRDERLLQRGEGARCVARGVL